MDRVNGSGDGRTRAGARRALLCGVAVAAALLGAVGTAQASPSPSARPHTAQSSSPDGPWAGGQKFSPPPAGPWPGGGGFTVALCWDNAFWEECHKRAVTAEQRRAIEARLRAMPQVADVRFRSRQEALEEFRERFADDEIMLSVMQAKDLPESFQGTLRSRADINRFGPALVQMPGVAYAYGYGHNFWVGKADVSVALCEEKSCEGRGPATPQERKAVEAKLANMPEVERVYVENAAHHRRVESFRWAKTGLHLEMSAPTYYVKLVDPEDARLFTETMKRLPGVGWTADVMDAD